MKELPPSPSPSLGLRLLARIPRWVRRVVSSRAHRASTGAGVTLTAPHVKRLQARAQRRITHLSSWAHNPASLSPSMADRFVEAVTHRFMPTIVRRLSEEPGAASLPPLDMPLVGGTSVQEDRLLNTSPPIPWPLTTATPPTSAGLPAHDAPNPQRVPSARPTSTRSSARSSSPVSNAPRPIPDRIRRYSRIEEIDPSTLAIHNERRRANDTPPANVASNPPFRPTQPAHEAHASPSSRSNIGASDHSEQNETESSFSALLTPSQRSHFTAPFEVEDAPAEVEDAPAPSGASPARADRASSFGDPLQPQSSTPPESSGLSVLQRLRQARAAQLRRQAERTGSNLSIAPRSSPPASVHPEQSSSDQGETNRPTRSRVPSQLSQSPHRLSTYRSADSADFVADAPADHSSVAADSGVTEPPSGVSSFSHSDTGHSASRRTSERATPSSGHTESSPVTGRPERSEPAGHDTTPQSERPQSEQPQSDKSLPLKEHAIIPSTAAVSLSDSATHVPSRAVELPIVRRAVRATDQAEEVKAPSDRSAQAIVAHMGARVMARATAGVNLPINGIRSAIELPLQTPVVKRRASTQTQQGAIAKRTLPPAPFQPDGTVDSAPHTDVLPSTAKIDRPLDEVEHSRRDAMPQHRSRNAAWAPLPLRASPMAKVHRASLSLSPMRHQTHAWSHAQEGLVGASPADDNRDQASQSLTASFNRPSPQSGERLTSAYSLPLARQASERVAVGVTQRLARYTHRDEEMPARIQQPSEQPLKRAPEPLPLVRRSTRVSRIQRATETTNVTSSASEVHSEKASQARQPDLHTLAYQVYPILKRMLAVERERLRGF